METVYKDFSPKGVRFYYIYKALAHPEWNGYVSPITIEERLMQVAEARRRLGSGIPWLCDKMSNDVKHALGNASNSEFIIDPELKVVVRRAWSDPDELRHDLEKLVGPVEHPTRVEDLHMQIDFEMPTGEVASGVIERLELPGRMLPLKTRAIVGKTPFYAKLRAEAERSLLDEGKGKLYLGFFLDRIYAVHWNNLVDPLEFKIESPEGVEVSPSRGQGPKLEQAADRDPREFLVEVSVPSREALSRPLSVRVRYFACDDANTFCVPVTQKYEIDFERDPDGGSRFGGGRGGFLARLMKRDKNSDGRLTRDELPERMRSRFDFLDRNGDGAIEREELQGRPGRGHRSPEQFLRRIMRRDADHDGRISREEAPPPLKRRFQRLDTNGDGYLDKTELRALVRRRPPRLER